MVLSWWGTAPSERGIVEREDMDIYEDARDIAEEQYTKPQHGTQSNNQQLDLLEPDSFE